MRISVIVPAHNEERFIGACLESIQQQTHPDVEIIVVCDACTDATIDIVRAAGLEPIEVHNRSTGLTLNAGLQRVTGDYFMCMGGDDTFVSRDGLRVLAESLERDPVDVLGFGSFFGPRLASQWIVPDEGELWPNVSYNLFKSSKYAGCLFPDASYLEDQIWFKEHVRPGHTRRFLDIPVYEYRYPQKSSAIGKSHAGGLKQAFDANPDFAPAYDCMRRLPIPVALDNLTEMSLILEVAIDGRYVLEPIVTFVTRDEPTFEDLRAIQYLLSLTAQEEPTFAVELESEREFGLRGDVWGFLSPGVQASDSMRFMTSLQILHKYGIVNSSAIRATERTGPERVADVGLPPSYAQAELSLLNELVNGARVARSSLEGLVQRSAALRLA